MEARDLNTCPLTIIGDATLSEWEHFMINYATQQKCTVQQEVFGIWTDCQKSWDGW